MSAESQRSLTQLGDYIRELEMQRAACLRLLERWRSDAVRAPCAMTKRACATELEATLREPHMDHVVCKLDEIKPVEFYEVESYERAARLLMTPLHIAGQARRTFEHELLWGHSAGKPFGELDECVPEDVRAEVGRLIASGYYGDGAQVKKPCKTFVARMPGTFECRNCGFGLREH